MTRSNPLQNYHRVVRPVRLSPQDRRTHLLEIGAEMFGEQPYDRVCLTEIAERAGVSRALMYHYFPDKRALFAAVVNEEAERLSATISTAAAAGHTLFDQLRDGVHTCLDYRRQYPHAAWAAYVGLGQPDRVLLGVGDEAKDQQVRRIMALLTAVMNHAASALDPDVERHLRVIVRGWLAFTFEVCQQHITALDTDAGRLSEACAHMLLDAIARLPGIPAELADAAAPHRGWHGS